MTDALRRQELSSQAFGDRLVETPGGEWQRVRIACALAAVPRSSPPTKPTAALDIGHEMALFELLRQLTTADGSRYPRDHASPEFAARFADRPCC